MSDVELTRAYAKWLTTMKEWELFSDLPEKKQYEAKNILERWKLARMNFGPKLSLECLKVAPFTKKMREEFIEKGFGGPGLDTLINNIIGVKPVDVGPVSEVIVDGSGIKYEKYSKIINPARLEILLARGTLGQIAAAALTYDSINSGSQQWNIPFSVYKVFVEKFGLQVEGFASPFNSQILMQKSPAILGFCSLFYETDKYFGSLGSFFDYNFVGKVATINPPYTLSIMDGAIQKALDSCEEAQKSGQKTRLFITLPNWADAECILKLNKTKFLEYKVILAPKKHYYENSANDIGKPIISLFETYFCVLSVGYDRANYTEVLRAWLPPGVIGHGRQISKTISRRGKRSNFTG